MLVRALMPGNAPGAKWPVLPIPTRRINVHRPRSRLTAPESDRAEQDGSRAFDPGRFSTGKGRGPRSATKQDSVALRSGYDRINRAATESDKPAETRVGSRWQAI
jgi:hypothetical protein